MRKIRKKLAARCAKITDRVLRIFGKDRGSAFPGYVAGKIEPELLAYLAGMIREKIIVTMGTNGKTTVNNMLYHVLRYNGKKVVANRVGANMQNGVVTAFALAADKKGELDADYACIEVDEFAAAEVLPKLKPDCVILTNIFRDQLDRFGEVDIVCERIREALHSVPDAKLILNGDDAFSASLLMQCPNPVITYGIDERIFDPVSCPEVQDSIFCRFCGEKLEYGFFHYGQLGIYVCPGCGFKRPRPDFGAERIETFEGGHGKAFREGYSFELDGERIYSQVNSAYNVYNTLSAYAALKTLGFSAKEFKPAIETFDYGNNRERCFEINEKQVQLFLAKNPVGFQQKIAVICRDKQPKALLIRIGDAARDGKDISWLWDVDFNYLKGAALEAVITAGSRRHDVALRLKYENLPCHSARTVRRALKRLMEENVEKIYIIVNYSGLHGTYRLLEKMKKRRERAV